MGLNRFIRKHAALVAGIAFGFACAPSAWAARHAMIVSVRAGEQQLSDKNKAYCRDTKALFEKAGFDRISLYFEGGKAALEGSDAATDTAILAQLAKEAKTLGPSDEFWLVLYGYASNSSRGVTLATKGKRLSGNKLAAALDQIKAPQYILALNQGSAPFMKLLCTRSDRCVLTAASSDAQLNPPLLPDHLFDIWATNLTTDCRAVFDKASAATEAEYEAQNLAVAEVSQLFDGTDIDVYPFAAPATAANAWSLAGRDARAGAEAEAVAVATATPDETTEPAKPAKIDFSVFDGMLTEREKEQLQPATDETRKLIEDARQQAPAQAGFPAFITRMERRMVINLDESLAVEKQSRIYLLDNVAVETYRRIMLEDYPPSRTLEIKTARVIYPDGRFMKLDATTVNNHDRGVRYHNLKVPAVQAGCLIELDIAETQAADSTLPIIDEKIPLQKSIPIASARVVVEYPKQRDIHYKLYGTTAIPEESTGEYSHKLDFEFGAIPALEPLPYDPPFNDMAIRLVVSSLDSWDAFREWSDQLLVGSDALDDTATEKAAALTAEAKTDAEKVQAIYEFLCDLRYETTPIGARAFRPRLPGEVCSSLYGDCKDKANALVAMARSVGVTGYMALVNRASSTDETFPSWQFNHAVAFFPKLEGYPDGLWCDATDGSTPFASLPPGDIDRSALVLMDDATAFKTIKQPHRYVSGLSQQWVLNVASDGSVAGTIEIAATGLSDYFLRRTLKRASPLQAQYTLQHMINDQVSGLSVDNIETTALSDLSVPLKVTAHCYGKDWSLVRASLDAPYDLWDAVAVPQRNRTLMLNDGQRLNIFQSIRIKGDSSTPSARQWEKKTDLATMEASYAPTDDGWERTARLLLDQPSIPPKDYPIFKAQVAEWNARLKHHLTDQEEGTK